MGQSLTQHPLCLDQCRSAFEQVVQVPLFARRWLPGMQAGMLVGDEAGQQEGIDMIGLGSLTNGVGVVTDVFGIEDINREAGPVRQKRQTFVIASGRFQSDLCSRWQRLEPGFEGRRGVPDRARCALAMRRDHDGVLSDIRSDKQWGFQFSNGSK